MRRPWLAFLILFGLFSLSAPYDWNNRLNREVNENDLKAAVSSSSANIEEGSSIRRYAILGFAVVALALTARRRWKERQQLPVASNGLQLGRDPFMIVSIVAFVGLALASAIWADDPGLVIRRGGVFLCLIFAAWAVARSWTLPDILAFTVLSCLAVLVTSLGLEILRGAFQPLDGGYRLSGLAHPNSHAQEAAAVIFCSIAAIRLIPEHRRFYILTGLAAFVLMLLTRSRTELLAVLVALGFGALYIMPKRRVFGIALVLTAVVLTVFVFGADVIDSAKHALLMGRQASDADVTTLTGRTELWAELFTYITARPVLGYGFEGFWSPAHTAYVSLALGWVVPHAHNGYIEMLLDLGAVGLTLFMAVLVSGVVHAQRRLRVSPGDTEALLAMVVLVWMLVAMVSEKLLPQTDFAGFLAMVLLAREAMTSPVAVAVRPVRAYARTVSA